MNAFDPALRMQVSQIDRDLRKDRILRQLQAGLALRGGRLPALVVSPPALSIHPVSGETDLPQPYHYFRAIDDGGALDTRTFAFPSGDWIPATQSYPLDRFAMAYGPHKGDGTADGVETNRATINDNIVQFVTSAPDLVIEFHNFAANGGGFRLLVDDAYVTTGKIGCDGSGPGRANLRITWGAGGDGDARPRTYRLIGGNAFRFGGVKCSALHAPWPAPLQGGLRVIVHGDSYVQGDASAVATAPHPTLAGCLGLLLGQDDCRPSGVGSTGFLARGAGLNTAVDRVDADIIAQTPDAIIDLMGLNDELAVAQNGQDATQFAREVERWILAIRKALPDSPIFMTGPMSPKAASVSRLAVAAAKRAVAERWQSEGVYFLENLGDAPWVSGTGQVAAPRGDGNADWVTGGVDGQDGAHPTPAGAAYLAVRIAGAMQAALATPTD